MARLRKENGPAPLQTIDRALRVIDYLAEVNDEVGVTEIARRIGIDPSSAYRILSTLARRQYVEQNAESAKYRLGMRLFLLGNRVGERLALPEIARPALEKLASLTGETANLLAPDGDQGVYLAGVAGSQTLRRVVSVGRRELLHCSAVGKAILAHLPPARVDAIIAAQGLPAVTAKTLSDPAQLKERLADIRARGYAIDDEEGEEGLRCVAAPILDHKGEVAAAISVAGPSLRLSLATLERLASHVVAAALSLSSQLGYQAEAGDRPQRQA